MKEISFIIPAYNVEKYIKRCIASIYVQMNNISRFEVLVVDDGSTDGTLKELDKLQAEHENLIVLTQANQGPGAARNAGLERSTGKYIWFIDADDYIVDGSVGYLLRHLNDEQLDFIFFNARIINTDGREINSTISGKLTSRCMTGVETMEIGFHIGSVCLVVWRRSFLERINLRFLPNVVRGEDSLFCFVAQLQAEKLRIIDKRFYVYEKREGTLTTLVTSESIRKQRAGDIAIAKSLRELSNTFEGVDAKKYHFIVLHKKQIEIGLLFSLLKNRKTWGNWGLNQEIIEMMKEEGLYPLRGPFGSYKLWLSGQILNIEPLVCGSKRRDRQKKI